jgi:hypothetical protein
MIFSRTALLKLHTLHDRIGYEGMDHYPFLKINKFSRPFSELPSYPDWIVQRLDSAGKYLRDG